MSNRYTHGGKLRAFLAPPFGTVHMQGFLYAASVRSVLSLADCKFIAVKSFSDSGGIIIARCLTIFYGHTSFGHPFFGHS